MVERSGWLVGDSIALALDGCMDIGLSVHNYYFC